MRRLLLMFVLVPSFGWVFWASCQPDDYRDTLPFRVFDAAPQEAGTPVNPADMVGRADQGASDMARLDQGTTDLPAPADGGAADAGNNDAGSSDAGGSDAGAGDAGTADGGALDSGRGD